MAAEKTLQVGGAAARGLGGGRGCPRSPSSRSPGLRAPEPAGAGRPAGRGGRARALSSGSAGAGAAALRKLQAQAAPTPEVEWPRRPALGNAERESRAHPARGRRRPRGEFERGEAGPGGLERRSGGSCPPAPRATASEDGGGPGRRRGKRTHRCDPAARTLARRWGEASPGISVQPPAIRFH